MRATDVAFAAMAAFLASSSSARAEDDGTKQINVTVQFATQLKDRAPVDPGSAFQPGKVYCWTDVKGGSGTLRLVHVWMRDDLVVHRQSVRVRGQSWVTWSYHDVGPGQWKVQVQDPTGAVVGQGSFTVTAKAKADRRG